MALVMAGLGCSLAYAQSGVALPFTPEFSLDGTPLTGNRQVIANPDDSYTLIGSQTSSIWEMAWDLTIKQDPFIIGTLTVTNLSSSAQNYNLTLGLPITPAFSSSLYGGSLSATVTDLNADLSATLGPSTASGAPPGIYRGTIDGSTVLNLFAIMLNCTGTSGGCVASGTDINGLPGPTLPGPGVFTSIGTLLSFNLSAGDRVVFNTNFTVTPVPLPAGLPLLGTGLLTLLGFRRRRALNS